MVGRLRRVICPFYRALPGRDPASFRDASTGQPSGMDCLFKPRPAAPAPGDRGSIGKQLSIIVYTSPLAPESPAGELTGCGLVVTARLRQTITESVPEFGVFRAESDPPPILRDLVVGE
jgi:hypothetical protein